MAFVVSVCWVSVSVASIQMAVTAVRLIDVDGGITQRAGRKYRLEYEVETDDVNDGPITARTGNANPAGQVPLYGTSFAYGNDTDVGAICYDKQAKLKHREETRKFWQVVCMFGTSEIAITGITEDEVDDPIQKPAHWSGNYIQYTRPYPQDKDGESIKNSAGDPFVDPPIIGDDSRMAIIVQKNFSAINLSVWASFRDAVNNATHWGLTARKIKVQRIQFDEAFYNRQVYYPVTFEFHVNDDTWDIKLLDAGFREKGSAGRITIKGTPVVRPWPLDGSGNALTQAQVDAAAPNPNINYETFTIYPEKDFSQLGLPAQLGGP